MKCNRERGIGVVGLGYVGLPLSLSFTDAGFTVTGFDIDSERVSSLQRAESYVDDVDDSRLASALELGFNPTDEATALRNCDTFIFAVPTEVKNGEPDLSALESAIQTVAENRTEADETTFIVASTVYPGAIDDVVKPVLQDASLTPGEDALVAMVPERLNPGSEYDLQDIPLVIGADSERERRAATSVFGHITEEVHPVNSTEIAAASKILENTYRLVNVSFINEFAAFADQIGINVWEVIEAASSKPFGFQPFYPGVGAGGHCIPVDPKYLVWRARNAGTYLQTVEIATEVNDQMPNLIANNTRSVLEQQDVKLQDAEILVFGLTYKPNVADVRNSAARTVSTILSNSGASVTAVDPLASEGVTPKEIEHKNEVSTSELAKADLVMILVPHKAFDFEEIAEHARLIYDVTNSISEDMADRKLAQFGGPKEGSVYSPQFT